MAIQETSLRNTDSERIRKVLTNSIIQGAAIFNASKLIPLQDRHCPPIGLRLTVLQS